MSYNKADLFRAVWRIETGILDITIEKGASVQRVSSVELSTDILAMEAAVENLERGVLGIHFLRMHHESPPNQFMWLSAKNDLGDVIGVTAVRLEDFGVSWSLKDFMMHRMRRIVPAKDGGFAELDANTSEFAKSIHGRCVYMGDTFVHKDWRHNNLSTLLTKYLALVAWDEWQPQILHGWIRKHHAESGLGTRWGFTEIYSPGMIWKSEPADPTWIDTCFVGMREDAISLLIWNSLYQTRQSPSNSS